MTKPTEKQIIQEVDDFYDSAKKEREVYEKDWYFNTAFYLGYQWLAWNDWTRKIEEPKAPSWRVRITANQIAPICDQIIAKLTNAPGNNAPIGGLKVVTDNGWFAARPSGTENIYKIYAESFRGEEHLHEIQEEARDIVSAAFKAAGL